MYQEGALLFVGDGHALEGDELNGDALETSMDVEFTVDLARGKNTQGPRFENDEYLMASGIGGSLQDALQEATTELAGTRLQVVAQRIEYYPEDLGQV